MVETMDKPIDQVDLRKTCLELSSIEPYSPDTSYLSKIRGLGFHSIEISYPNGHKEIRHESDGKVTTYDPWGHDMENIEWILLTRK